MLKKCACIPYKRKHEIRQDIVAPVLILSIYHITANLPQNIVNNSMSPDVVGDGKG